MPFPSKVCSCPTCPLGLRAQPLTAFGLNIASPDGHHWYCRNCNNAKQRQWKKANKAKVLADKRAYDERKRQERKAAAAAAGTAPNPAQLELDI